MVHPFIFFQFHVLMQRLHYPKLCSNYFKLFIHQELQIKKYILRSIVSKKPNKEKKKKMLNYYQKKGKKENRKKEIAGAGKDLHLHHQHKQQQPWL